MQGWGGFAVKRSDAPMLLRHMIEARCPEADLMPSLRHYGSETSITTETLTAVYVRHWVGSGNDPNPHPRNLPCDGTRPDGIVAIPGPISGLAKPQQGLRAAAMLS